MQIPDKLFIPGAFDVLHLGHITFISNSINNFKHTYKKLPSKITFYLPSDIFLYKRKGQFRPFFPIHVRQQDLKHFMLSYYPEIQLEFKINNNNQIKLDTAKNLTLQDILKNYNIKDINTTAIAQGPDYYHVYQILKNHNMHVIINTTTKSQQRTSYIEKALLENKAPLIIFRNYQIHTIFKDINLDNSTVLQEIHQDDYIFTKEPLPRTLIKQLIHKNIKRYVYLLDYSRETNKACNIFKKHKIYCRKGGL